jgi:hypothetical protein
LAQERQRQGLFLDILHAPQHIGNRFNKHIEAFFQTASHDFLRFADGSKFNRGIVQVLDPGLILFVVPSADFAKTRCF